MVLIIDNHDSFVYNLARYIVELGYKVQVVRNNTITLAEVIQLNPSHIVISPGPGRPADAGISLQLVKKVFAKIPLLGVCLGHQVIAQAFGADIVVAEKPLHGVSSAVYNDGSGVFQGLQSPIYAARYHSLIIAKNNLARDFSVNGWSIENEVMAIKHKHFPLWGVQFHPESILTNDGYKILQNFLNIKIEIQYD